MSEIAIIVPIYNADRYLPACLNSILHQSFTDFILVLVDDGSTDNSSVICNECSRKDRRVKVIHQSNAGAASARNRGLDYVYSESTSSWIVFIDADDWIHEDYLKRLYESAKKNKLEFITCKILCIKGEQQKMDSSTGDLQFLSPDDFWSMDVTTATSPCAKLFSRSLFSQFRFPEGKNCEDLFLLYRIVFSFAKVGVIFSPMYYYRYDPVSMSNKPWTFGRMDAIEALSEQCIFFHNNHYKKAEETAAYGLFHEVIYALRSLIERFPEEKKLIRNLRKKLFFLRWKYRKSLLLKNGNGKRTYEILVYPYFYRFKKKWKHLIEYLTHLFLCH